uniref:Uncharacterized protein n=1 Tax=Zea mays TaxID=4577 RepID=A0A804LSK3_MAIZE
MIHHSCSAEEPAEREADAGDADADGERDPPRGHPAGSVVRFRTIRISSWSSEQGILGLQHHDPAAVGGERDGVPHEQRREVDVGGARGRQLVLRLPRARLRQAQRPQQAVVVVALQLRLQPALVLPPLVRCWIHIHRIG